MKNTHKIVLFALAMSLCGCSPYHGVTNENIEKSLIACASMGGLKAIRVGDFGTTHLGPDYYGKTVAICKNGYEILIGGDSK